jgi:hypothetical protein
VVSAVALVVDAGEDAPTPADGEDAPAPSDAETP